MGWASTMFGFLKKKLKDAVNKFSKKAEEEVIEESVKDEKDIEEAKREEEELLKEPVIEIPETEKEKEEHEKEKKELKEKVEESTEKRVKRKKENRKEKEEKKEEGAKEVKRDKRPETKPVSKKEKIPGKKLVTKESEQVEEETPKQKGFLKKIFKKKSAELVAETSEQAHEPNLKEEETAQEQLPKTEEPVPKQEELDVEHEHEAPAVEKERVKETIEAEPEPKRGLFDKLKESFTKKTLSEEKFEELFWDLEVVLLENNVAVEVIEKLKEELKKELTSGKVSRLGIEQLILSSLRRGIKEVLDIPSFDLVERIKKEKKRPFVIAFIGVNGSGKTTTLAKIANKFQEEGLSVVIAASDTFRAAAIDQLAEHAHRLNIKMISQGYGADPAAVAYDAIEHAKAKAIDVVMIDTAGRLHSNTNLMAELEKVVRVAKPDLKIFIGESTTGNDCVEQAKEFDKRVGIDAVILSKVDVDEKGGAAISVSYVTGKPILYMGVGQAYGDLKRFDKEEILRNLGL